VGLGVFWFFGGVCLEVGGGVGWWVFFFGGEGAGGVCGVFFGGVFFWLLFGGVVFFGGWGGVWVSGTYRMRRNIEEKKKKVPAKKRADYIRKCKEEAFGRTMRVAGGSMKRRKETGPPPSGGSPGGGPEWICQLAHLQGALSTARESS